MKSSVTLWLYLGLQKLTWILSPIFWSGNKSLIHLDHIRTEKNIILIFKKYSVTCPHHVSIIIEFLSSFANVRPFSHEGLKTQMQSEHLPVGNMLWRNQLSPCGFPTFDLPSVPWLLTTFLGTHIHGRGFSHIFFPWVLWLFHHFLWVLGGRAERQIISL